MKINSLFVLQCLNYSLYTEAGSERACETVGRPEEGRYLHQHGSLTNIFNTIEIHVELIKSVSPPVKQMLVKILDFPLYSDFNFSYMEE